MRAVPIDRTHLAQAVLASALTLAALVVLGAVLARWTWVWLAPEVEAASTVVAPTTGAGTRAGHLFGQASATAVAGTSASVGVRLLGIVAAIGASTGYAVLQVDGQPITVVHEGADIAPGLRLLEVAPREVVIERGGTRQSLSLPTADTPAPVAQ